TRARRTRRCGVVPARTKAVSWRTSGAVNSSVAAGPGMHTPWAADRTQWRTTPVGLDLPNGQVDGSGHAWVCGTLPSMPPAKRRPDTSWLPTVVPTVQSLLDHGEATRGM